MEINIFASLIPFGFRGGVLDLVLGAGPVVKLVLILLLFLSIVSWAIILLKFKVVRQADKESKIFLKYFWESKDFSASYAEARRLKNSPLAEIFRASYLELNKLSKAKPSSNPPKSSTLSTSVFLSAELEGIDNLTRTLKKATNSEITRLEKFLSFLATTGNTAPFIGLFGTVWGIMDAFRQIGVRGSTNLAIVAPGISEALIATAAGLAAAIPAVVAYNYYLNRIRVLAAEMENFSSEFLNLIERYFLSK